METGALEKLVIKAYTEPDYPESAAGEQFHAYINPNEITLSYELEYEEAQASGTSDSPMKFKKIKPGDLSLTFFLDGTGANGHKIDVQEEVRKFQTVAVEYNGEIHRPNYLIVAWGTLEVKRCVLKSASIAYKLFKPDGVPLRAVITANFTSNSDDKTRVALEQRSSPDLTHVQLVKAGDTLPALCHRIYGDPGYYLDVARANRMDHFRRLTPGTKIFFPPLEK